MLVKSLILKIASLFISVILLSQCAKVTEAPIQPFASQQQAATAPSPTPFTMPAASYLALAKNQTEAEKQNLLIMASGRFIYDGHWRDGVRTLALTNNLTRAQAYRKAILLAKTDLIREQPRAAITKLSSVREISSLPTFYQVQYHEILAFAYESALNRAESVVERMKLEPLLADDEAGRNRNRRLLWLTLNKLPLAELDTLAVEAPESSFLAGWAKLALIARKKSDNAQSLYASIEQWQLQYSRHPANQLLPSPLDSIKPQLHSTPRQVALLLPLTGPLAGPGGAIRDGFMAAATNSSTKVRLYNTSSADISALYQKALADGADYVVGPLSKPDVAVIASLDHPVPTLLLNDSEILKTANAYRFGLSPSNEAKQVAMKASQRGYKRALIIAPAGAWGDEIVSAFSIQWRNEGGKVVDKLAYANHENLDLAIRNLLRVSDSESREKQLKQLLGTKIQAVPSRRQDFDLIFLLAYPSKARQIMPLLKYYFAGNVPVYATSAVYAGNTNIMKDKDLDSIIFSDMPWVFAHQMGNRNWPEQLNSYNRLYALGMDSFALASQLNQLLLFPAMGINDKSGILYLNNNQQIVRVPAWGQFKNGVATSLS